MTQSTTYWYAIRDNYITKILALTPSNRSTPFRERPIRRQSLREWAVDRGSDAFRKFEIVRIEGGEEAAFMDTTVYEVNEVLQLTVAYPSSLSAMFGDEADDDLEQYMEQDADQLRDVLTSTGNLISGQNTCRVTGIEVEKDDEVWFQTITFAVQYYKAQTLT